MQYYRSSFAIIFWGHEVPTIEKGQNTQLLSDFCIF